MAVIYGLVSSGLRDRIGYVGSTQGSPKHRLPNVTKVVNSDDVSPKTLWLLKILISKEVIEQIILEEFDTISEEDLTDRENFWIDKLRAEGHPLTNAVRSSRGRSRVYLISG